MERLPMISGHEGKDKINKKRQGPNRGSNAGPRAV